MNTIKVLHNGELILNQEVKSIIFFASILESLKASVVGTNIEIIVVNSLGTQIDYYKY